MYPFFKSNIIDLRLSSQVRFERIDTFLSYCFAHWAFGVPQVTEKPRPHRARLYTGRNKSPLYPVIAPVALVDYPVHAKMGLMAVGQHESCSIGACLDAIPAADTVLLIDKDYAVICDIGSANRTNGYTRWFVTLIAEFGDEKAFTYT